MPVPAMILSVSRQGFVFLPVLFIANALVGLDGLIFAQPIADICSVIMALVMMEMIKHKDKKLLTAISNILASKFVLFLLHIEIELQSNLDMEL